MLFRGENYWICKFYSLCLQKYITPYYSTRPIKKQRNMEYQQSSVKERLHVELHEPRQYKVIIFNDDVTTMDFVVMLLVQIFHKDTDEAEELMLAVHNNGSAVVGIYSYDVARTRVERSLRMAKANRFPLKLVYEPEL